ncbi:uncharacterized protein LOC106012824 [Aplysia californica]|uniref:Uncharacterized protein LOC106012824 n=1 Tax=Aplysia californica TaxID=6500 RepID=A0ABM1A7J8_APLCA|nr:uncharacterized protein LOC106012824 [Aplysia californica]
MGSLCLALWERSSPESLEQATETDRVYPESQCGFRTQCSASDMIFSLRQLQEKCREQGQPLYLSFIDLTKAFDLVSRESLFRVLTKIGCPPRLLCIIQSFHTYMKGIVQFDGFFSQWSDKVTNVEVLTRAQIPSLFTTLRQRRLRWLGHMHRMPDGRILKDLLYGELAP